MTSHIRSYPHISKCLDQDIDEFSASLSTFTPDLKQLSKGFFQGSSTAIQLPDLMLMKRSSGARYAATCRVPPRATLLFPLQGGAIYARGQMLGENRQIGSVGGHESHVIFPEHHSHLIVTIPIATLSHHLGHRELETFVDVLNSIESCLIDSQSKRLTTARLLAIFEQLENAAAPLSPQALQECTHSIVALLYDYLAYQKCQGNVAACNLERILCRALSLIETNTTHMFTLDELARQTFASKRTIQYAFSSLLGLSPMRFQKWHRFNLIRRELSMGQSAARFAEIAARYAFSNPGRLSREYAEFFGEGHRETKLRTQGSS